MGVPQSKPAIQNMQEYHGAQSALQFSLGIDMVVEYWIRKQCDIDIRTIPVDIFRSVLNYTAFFDRFEFQQNIYWRTDTTENWKAAQKKNGMGCHHNILFGSVLTGDICYKCDVKLQYFQGFSKQLIDKSYAKSTDKDILSVGLVEKSYYDYLEQNMHKGNGRCVFRATEYYDCNGHMKLYDDASFSALRGAISFEISINMKSHTFTITDSNGISQTISNIPDQRVICFELWPTDAVAVYNQRLQWVA